jgi:hypothetical protein
VHLAKGTLDDPLYTAPPAGMDGPDDPAARLDEEDGQAIGGADAEPETSDIGYHCIVEVIIIQQESGELLASRQGPIHDEHIIPVDLADPHDAGRVQTEGTEIPAPILAHRRRIIADAQPEVEGMEGGGAHPPLPGAEGVPDP